MIQRANADLPEAHGDEPAGSAAAAQELQALEQERRLWELRLDVARLRQMHQLQEADRLTEFWPDLVDPREWNTDDTGRPFAGGLGQSRSPAAASVSAPGSEQDLRQIRQMARWLCETSPLALGLLQQLTNYVIGAGFRYTVTSKQQADPDLVAAAQQTVDAFLDDNDWVGDFEHELFRRAHRDGEFFVRLCASENGQVLARVIEPEQVVEPAAPSALADTLEEPVPPGQWSHGILTHFKDVQTVFGYHVSWGLGERGEFVPEAIVEHFKLNVDRNVKRGLSDFYAVQSHIEGAAKLLRNTWEGAAIQAAIAFVREHANGVGAAAVESLRANQTDWARTARAGGGRTTYFQRYEPGTILDVPRGQIYKPAPLGRAHAASYLAIEQAVLRMVGLRWSMPEYMVSADASNANYASTLVAESPFVKYVVAQQRLFASHMQRLIWKVLRLVFLQGRFRGQGLGPRQLTQLLDVQIEPPDVAVRDRRQETEIRAILYRQGLLSRRTWAAREGLDWQVEQANLHQEREHNAAESDPLLPE